MEDSETLNRHRERVPESRAIVAAPSGGRGWDT